MASAARRRPRTARASGAATVVVRRVLASFQGRARCEINIVVPSWSRMSKFVECCGSGLTPDSVCEKKSAAPTKRRRHLRRARIALSATEPRARVRACLNTRDDGTCFRLEMCWTGGRPGHPTATTHRPRPPPRPRPPRFSNGDARACADARSAHSGTDPFDARPPTFAPTFPVARRPRRRAARTRVSRVRCSSAETRTKKRRPTNRCLWMCFRAWRYCTTNASCWRRDAT